MGGGDPNFNPRLRQAIATARGESMPVDNIERAIKKGTGELEGAAYEEMTYEGYGPGGVAILLEAATDNKNRSAAEIRAIFTKNHGHLAGSGSVAWMFHRKGVITITAPGISEDDVILAALDAGAEDVRSHEDDHRSHHAARQQTRRRRQGPGTGQNPHRQRQAQLHPGQSDPRHRPAHRRTSPGSARSAGRS